MTKLTCRDCIHYDVCDYHITELTTMTVEECSHEFKNKADFAEVVRCKDCKHFYADKYNGKVLRKECGLRSLGGGIGTVRLESENDFCSYGERKTE